MFNNYEAQEFHAKHRLAEAVEAAEKHRLAQNCKPATTSLSSQLLASIGDVLVEVGSRLQEQRSNREQYQPTSLESSRL